IVAANTAYLRGDRFTLQAYLGLTAGQASRFAGRWFFLKPPSGAYAVVAEAVRLQSFVAELRMPAPYTTAPATTIGGKHVTGVEGPRYATDLGPGPRERVQPDRAGGRRGRARPVRGVGRDGARGAVPRRRARDVRRVRSRCVPRHHCEPRQARAARDRAVPGRGARRGAGADPLRPRAVRSAVR